MGFDIPLIDWGRRNARYKTAKAQEKLVDYTNESTEISIVQEVTTLVKNIEILKGNIRIAKMTDSVADKRFIIATKLYQTGKLSIAELNLAQNEKDNLRRAYVSSIRDFYNSLFFLRKLTLYDFEHEVPLYFKK